VTGSIVRPHPNSNRININTNLNVSPDPKQARNQMGFHGVPGPALPQHN